MIKDKGLHILWGSLIVEELVRLGVETFCVAPGSRSTPLVYAVSQNKKAKSILFYDERALGFYALGKAKATQKPVALITTSGTAGANLYPAIIEASQTNTPLIILTADRPPELFQTNANQTIDQSHLFGKYVRFFFDLPTPSDDFPLRRLLTTVDLGYQKATQLKQGPVHFNCQFRKPLEPIESEIISTQDIDAWFENGKPFTAYEPSQLQAELSSFERFLLSLGEGEKGWLVIGDLKTSDEREVALKMAKKLHWPVYATIGSGLRLGSLGTHIVRHLDTLQQEAKWFEENGPDYIIHLGGRIISKRFHEVLEKFPPKQYFMLKEDSDRYDPAGVVTHHFHISLSKIDLAKLPDFSKNEYQKQYREYAGIAQTTIETKAKEADFLSEVFVSRSLSRLIPSEEGLFISNSMPIRDMDLYSTEVGNQVEVGLNRGASGIDGIMSTACGFAAGIEKRTTVLIGDLAFMHDLNSLSLIAESSHPLIIVLVNNAGGGIFHFLPIVKEKEIFEKYFATAHDWSFEKVVQNFGLDYFLCETKEAFETSYQEALKHKTSCVIEVKTDREANLTLRRDIKKEIIERVGAIHELPKNKN